jgi:hypothetical protein
MLTVKSEVQSTLVLHTRLGLPATLTHKPCLIWCSATKLGLPFSHPTTSRQPLGKARFEVLNLPKQQFHLSETSSSCTPQLHNSQYLFVATSIAQYQNTISLRQEPVTISLNMYANAFVALALFAAAVSAQTNASYIDPNSVEPDLKGK